MGAKNVLVPLTVIVVLLLGLYGVARIISGQNFLEPTPSPTPSPRLSITPSPSLSPSPSPTANSRLRITIGSNGFSPMDLTVSKGTEVTFVNNNTVNHTVTAENRAFDSGDIEPGQSFSYTFNKEGTFSFFCKSHPDEKGQVTVK